MNTPQPAINSVDGQHADFNSRFLRALGTIILDSGEPQMKVCAALEISPGYPSMIRKGVRTASEKLVKKAESLVEVVKSKGSAALGAECQTYGLHEFPHLIAVQCAESVGLSVPSFINECVRRYGNQVREQLLREFPNLQPVNDQQQEPCNHANDL